MGTPTIIRGEDHLSNTSKQILLYDALSLNVPIFAHLPMILGSDKKRLSKRHGALGLQTFLNKGYLPSALMNYLALLGWFESSHTGHIFFSLFCTKCIADVTIPVGTAIIE